MKKHSGFWPAILNLLWAFACLPSIVQADTVSIFIWEEYLAEEVVDAFEEDTGHTIKLVYFDNEDERDQIVSSGRSSAFDLVLIDDLSLKNLDSANRFESIEEFDIAAIGNLDQSLQKNCQNRGVAYAWGTNGIAYRTSIYPQGIDSWQQLFAPPAVARQRVVLQPDTTDLVGGALLALGFDPFSGDQGELRQAYDLMHNQQASEFITLGYGITYALDHEADSDMTMAFAYSGDVYQIAEATGQQDWVYTLPKEGSMIWVDCLARPLGRQASQATLDFLAFINQPNVAAFNAQAVWFATANRAALEFTEAEYRNDSELFPGRAVIDKSHYYQPLDRESFKLRGRIIKSLSKALSRKR